VWDNREKLFKRIRVRILSNQVVIPIDRCSEYNRKNVLNETVLLHTELITFTSSVQFTQEGTKVITIN